MESGDDIAAILLLVEGEVTVCSVLWVSSSGASEKGGLF